MKSLADIKNGTGLLDIKHDRVSKPKLILVDDLLDHTQNRAYQEERIDALVKNIKEDGLLQPIVITPSVVSEGKYTILAGHHRVQAYKLLAKDDDTERYQMIQSIVLPTMTEVDSLKHVLTTNSNPELNDEEKEQLLIVAKELYQQLIKQGDKPVGRERDWLVRVTGLSQYFIRKFEGDAEEKKELPSKPKKEPTIEEEAQKFIKQMQKHYDFLSDNFSNLEPSTQSKIKKWHLDLETVTK